jgi:NAD(P)-dependent dehydrogenase (short-subunit alcohol dehydrogenase family)
MSWTEADLPDLTGLTAVVTGANSGIGLITARELAAHGARVVLACRNVAAAESASLEIVGDTRVEQLDLSALASVRDFAERWHGPLDLLVNNAGVMTPPTYRQTVDAFEMQFGTNHLGHFLLTARLAPALLAGDAPRVVTLSSAGHSRSDVDLDDPGFEHTEYSPWIAYGRSKTANALFARELARRAGGRGLLSFSVHPGGIMTDLGRHLTDELIAEMASFASARTAAAGGDAAAPAEGEAAPPSIGFEFKPVAAGAATQVWAATAPGLAEHNGAYLADCGLGVLGANPGTNGFLPHLLDDERAAALWDLSERLVGTEFRV